MRSGPYNLNILCTLSVLSLVYILPSIASGDESKTLKREMDPVVVAGDHCKDCIGQSMVNYGLYALRNGRLDPIPFQIDELDGKGQYVLTNGKGKAEDSDKGLFDSNDQLVFMALDTGDRLVKHELVPQDARGCIEIAVADPVTGDKGWVYLMTFPGPVARSAIDYVRYEPEDLRITARNYVAQFDKRFPAAAEKYAFRETIGGDGTDIIDRVKIRTYIKFVVGLHRTEEDILVSEIGYIDGPVRVIVRARNTINLFLGIPAMKTVGNALYYYSYADFPLIIDTPVRPTEFRVQVYDEFMNLAGWTMYSSTNPKGHPIDGVMDDRDKDVDLSPWKWSAISNGRLTFWSLALYPPACPVNASLYYNDDIAARKLPEGVPGEVPGLGWDVSEGWDKVERFPFEMRLLHFFTEGYAPGDEKAVVNIHDYPLVEEVKKIK